MHRFVPSPARWTFARKLLLPASIVRGSPNAHLHAARIPPAMVSGELDELAPQVRQFIDDKVALCQPDRVHICDGSESENLLLMRILQEQGIVRPLPKYKNCWLAITDPADVARVEGKTFMVTKEMRETTPIPKAGVKGQLSNWMSHADFEKAYNERFPGCMRGRTMYVIPFSMGPVGSPLAKVGVELTDSAYVAASMQIMTRVGAKVLANLKETNGTFVKGLHSVGQPLPMSKPPTNYWPCNPEKTIVAHIPERNEICSFGSGYGGNSLLGKKCLALRLGSIIARNEGWLAEHMLILGITNPRGVKRYIAAAFPSACGKTNLAMMNPTLPGYKVECVGDDIAWMSFDSTGQLRAINPEAGFFGVAPGTSSHTNPNAMRCIAEDTLFTNVALTSDGGVYWEGMDPENVGPNATITSWTGLQSWTPASGKPAAHPNSRFCTPARRCPIIDPSWEDPKGVPIDAIIFGGRRPEGVPLVYEAFNWKHGVMVGASMRSEATAAAEHQGKVIMNDPFAMRPFFGYNFGNYLVHWLSMDKPGRRLPKVFHVNWFRKDPGTGKFLWPGFGDNSRVLDWILRRVDGENCARPSAIGQLPKNGSLNLHGLHGGEIDMAELMSVPKQFWQHEVSSLRQYFDEQVNADMPAEIWAELKALEDRIQKMAN